MHLPILHKLSTGFKVKKIVNGSWDISYQSAFQIIHLMKKPGNNL